MRGSRTLLIVILLLAILVVAALGAYLYLKRQPLATTDVADTPTPEPVTTQIVVAVQNITGGMLISASDNAIQMKPWPADALPADCFTDIADVDGKFARMDIPLGMPVLRSMLYEPGKMMSAAGSSAALFSPNERVAYAIPMDTQGAVAWALKPGDHVDVIAALEMVAVSSESVTEGIKQFTYLDEQEMPSQTSVFGRFEQLPNGRWAAIYPVDTATALLPTMFVQLTVQDAIVWHVGIWEDGGSTVTAAGTVAQEAPASDTTGLLGGASLAAATPAPVVPTFRDVEPVTLLVTREDALVLKYLTEMGADLDLVLRPIGFTETALQTQPVWFRYILDKYQLPSAVPDEPVAPSAVQEPLELLPLVTPTEE